MALAAFGLAGLVVLVVGAVVALRMRQAHELALLSARTKPDEQAQATAVNIADLQTRVATLEASALAIKRTRIRA